MAITMKPEGNSSSAIDPWDAALLGGAAASMYRTTTPTNPPAKEVPEPLRIPQGDVTSLFRPKAGIPRDITQASEEHVATLIPIKTEQPVPSTAPVFTPTPAPLPPVDVVIPQPLVSTTTPMTAKPLSITEPIPAAISTPTPSVAPIETISETTPAPEVEIIEPIRPVLSPLSPGAILLNVPKKSGMTQTLLPAPAVRPALTPAHPMATVMAHLFILLLGIPLFVGGFYLADYTKDYANQATEASVSHSTQNTYIPAVVPTTATSTSSQ